jgi:iron-sulfur cluster repair protein YtfE (RIC family)
MTAVIHRGQPAVASTSQEAHDMANAIVEKREPQPAGDDTASIMLTLHHRRLDDMLSYVEIAAEIQSWKQARALFVGFREELEEHIRIEEEVMFPAMDPFRVPTSPVVVMRAEHREIALCVEVLDQLLDAEQSVGEAVARLEAVLAEHNRKEEGVLYPMFERLAIREDRAALIGELRPLFES